MLTLMPDIPDLSRIQENNAPIRIKDNEFKTIAGIVYDKFGINLGEHKKALVVGRLNKVLKTMGLSGYGEYIEYIQEDKSGYGLSMLIDKISTNHTFFFRENNHFKFLMEKVLPYLPEKVGLSKNKELRIWCAGCSSGEEPYTLAMVLEEYFSSELNKWDCGILATDISAIALEKAKQGIYPLERLKELPVSYRHEYFRENGNGNVSVTERLKKHILFKRFNLMNDVFPFKGQFDLIFCRNVMIYFDKVTRENLIRKFHRYIKPGGYLFIGHSESLDRKTSSFRYICPAVYQKDTV